MTQIFSFSFRVDFKILQKQRDTRGHFEKFEAIKANPIKLGQQRKPLSTPFEAMKIGS